MRPPTYPSRPPPPSTGGRPPRRAHRRRHPPCCTWATPWRWRTSGCSARSCAATWARSTRAPPTRGPRCATTWRAPGRGRSSPTGTRRPPWCDRCTRTMWSCSSGATPGATPGAWTGSPTTTRPPSTSSGTPPTPSGSPNRSRRPHGAKRPKIVWVLQGPDPITPDRIRRVNSLYEEQAAASGDLVADAGKTVSPAGCPADLGPVPAVHRLRARPPRLLHPARPGPHRPPPRQGLPALLPGAHDGHAEALPGPLPRHPAHRPGDHAGDRRTSSVSMSRLR